MVDGDVAHAGWSCSKMSAARRATVSPTAARVRGGESAQWIGRSTGLAAYDARRGTACMIAVVRTSLVLALLLVSSCSFYLSEPRVPKTDLRATLAGAYEVPPTQSSGGGYFEAVYRPSTKV